MINTRFRLTHLVNAMNKVLNDCMSGIMIPFLDDIPIKGCSDEDKDESKDKDGCRKFVVDHMKDCEKVLQRLEDANLTFSGEKSAFGKPEDLGIRSLMWSIWPEAFAIQGECNPRHERRMCNPNGGSKVPWSMRVLSYLDSTLCPHC